MQLHNSKILYYGGIIIKSVEIQSDESHVSHIMYLLFTQKIASMIYTNIIKTPVENSTGNLIVCYISFRTSNFPCFLPAVPYSPTWYQMIFFLLWEKNIVNTKMA
jgi:hypothetical protein